MKIIKIRLQRGQRSIDWPQPTSLPPASRLVLLGCNGSGKSTLLRAIAGLEAQAIVEIEDWPEFKERAFLHQEPVFLRGSALDNIVYGLRLRGKRRAEAQAIALEALRSLDFQGDPQAQPQQLSGGERRRIAIARLLVLQPKLLLLDEALADLDDEGQRSLLSKLNTISETQMTRIILSSPRALELPAPWTEVTLPTPTQK